MPKSYAKKALLAKIETTYGTDPTPTGAANAILAMNFSVSPMQGQDVPRAIELPYFTADQIFPTGLYLELNFDIELVGHATKGTAPGWGPIARMCGLGETVSAGTSVTYSRISSNLESGTVYFHIDGVKHAAVGCRGNAVFKVNANGLPVISVRLIGLYSTPTDTADPTPTLTAFQQPQVVNKTNTPTFTINAAAIPMRTFELDLGNAVSLRELVGVKQVVCPDANPSVKVQTEAVAMSVLNPFSLAENQTAFAVSLVHGVGSGKVVTISLPYARMQRVQGYTEVDKVWEWPFNMTPMPSAGNDELSIVLT